MKVAYKSGHHEMTHPPNDPRNWVPPLIINYIITHSFTLNWCIYGAIWLSTDLALALVRRAVPAGVDVVVAGTGKAANASFACLIVSMFAKTSLQLIATRFCFLAFSSSICFDWATSWSVVCVISHYNWSNILPILYRKVRTERDTGSWRRIKWIKLSNWRLVFGVT